MDKKIVFECFNSEKFFTTKVVKNRPKNKMNKMYLLDDY